MSNPKETIIIIHEEIICLSGDIPAENQTPIPRRSRQMKIEKTNKENNIEEPHHNIIRND